MLQRLEGSAGNWVAENGNTRRSRLDDGGGGGDGSPPVIHLLLLPLFGPSDRGSHS